MNDDDRIAYLAGDPDGRIDDLDERADLDELRALLADPGLWDEPAPFLEDAVVEAVTNAVASARVAAQVPSPESDAAAAQAQVVPIRRRRQKWPRSAVVLAAAAAAIVVVTAVVVVTAGNDDDTSSFSMALEATEVVPDASGEATLTRTPSGWRIELDATGLPRLDSGRFYQAWLRDADGTLIPIGTFNEGAEVVLWAGVSPVDFPTLTVTEEAADGDQGSSGVRVLVGSITPD